MIPENRIDLFSARRLRPLLLCLSRVGDLK
jgi:hypothetical protein